MTQNGDALVFGGIVDRGVGKDIKVAAKPKVDDGIGFLIGACARCRARDYLLIAANQWKGVADRKER